MDTLNRGSAPFPPAIWSAIDEAAANGARDQLTGRRFLELEGPFGVGLTTIEVGNDDYCRQPGPDEAGAILGRAIPLPMIRKSFRLSIRRVAAHVENGQPLDLSPAQSAAEAVADREEELIYQGTPSFGLHGLLTIDGHQEITGGDWTSPERALQDVLEAATQLDNSGLRGPYALALAPALYNNLFRLFPGTEITGVEHLRRLCTAGIYKAPIKGGVLVDTRVGTLVLGQDLQAGYSSQDGVHYHLFVSESIVLRIDDPKAICVIKAPSA
ncbi:MAG: bacteriocin family protein [Alphaproteobacteria bacterium]|nr:bacteriocin family protein [Alphaproteobacteria bacterium]